MFLGYVFIALCESVLDEKEYSLGELSGANAKRAMLVLLQCVALACGHQTPVA